MYKIAVMGDYDSIYGFAALGLDIYPAANRKEAEEKLESLAGKGYGIIYITEALAAECKQIIEKYQEQVLPAKVRLRKWLGRWLLQRECVTPTCLTWSV